MRLPPGPLAIEVFHFFEEDFFFAELAGLPFFMLTVTSLENTLQTRLGFLGFPSSTLRALIVAVFPRMTEPAGGRSALLERVGYCLSILSSTFPLAMRVWALCVLV